MQIFADKTYFLLDEPSVNSTDYCYIRYFYFHIKGGQKNDCST